MMRSSRIGESSLFRHPFVPSFNPSSNSDSRVFKSRLMRAWDDLTAWIEDVVSKNRTPYQGSKIIAGSLNLEKRTAPQSVLTRAVTGYLGFLAEAQGILSDLESKKPEGLVRAREVVCTIVARLAIGRELFEPIRELKDFDSYTFTHALNVCVLSSALARALRVSDEMVHTIAMAGLCHDLGKKEVPKEILNYNGPLGPEDRLLIEKHPSFGAQLLLDITWRRIDKPSSAGSGLSAPYRGQSIRISKSSRTHAAVRTPFHQPSCGRCGCLRCPSHRSPLPAGADSGQSLHDF